MRIVTFNTQHCAVYPTGRINLSRFGEYIGSLGADVVGLNEIRGEGPEKEYSAQTEALNELSGMSSYYFAPAIYINHSPYGNALLSRFAIESVENIPIPDPSPRAYDGYYETRCLIKARLKGDVTVLVTHFGLNPDEQESAVRTVLENIEDERCILMGDFNTEPDNPLLDPIRARMKDAAGISASKPLTYPSDAPRVKIDYIFVSRDITVKDFRVPSDVVSDHLPCIADIDVPEQNEI